MYAFSIEQEPTAKRKIRQNPWSDLAKAVLEDGIRVRDYFDYRGGWLYVLCGLAKIHTDNYYAIMDYIYGPRRKTNE